MIKIGAMRYAIVIAIGLLITALSGVYTLSFMAILGVTIAFWGIILYYIRPTKQVPISIITATSSPNTDNLNRIFSELNITQKGIYLPPSKLYDPESSLIFIPKKPLQTIPSNDEITNNLFTTRKDGILLSPPGYGLTKIMEQKLGKSFSKLDLQNLKTHLPRLLVEDLEIAENLYIETETNIVTFKIEENIFMGECNQAQKHLQVHDAIGCLLSSALACALTKATGKPVTINNEETIGKTTKIIYQLVEEQ
ncbi:MAG: hypothetical protein LBC03_06650 [Nitrososphaerota archaeon]|jgi:hypothetical protein|nr:hypothetical protein [Nitrososphaerota archaeon]